MTTVMPVNEATPRDRRILLFVPAGGWSTGEWMKPFGYWALDSAKLQTIGWQREHPPTLWCELPPEPAQADGRS